MPYSPYNYAISALGLGAAIAVGPIVERLAGTTSWRLRAYISSACVLAMAWGYSSAAPYLILESWILAFALVILASTDLLVLRLPNAVTLPLLAAGIAMSLLDLPPSLADRIIGGCIGYLTIAMIAHIHRKLSGREGIGLGDAKLLAAAGAWLGWTGLPSVVLLASVGGLIWAAVRFLLDRNTLSAPIPFGVPLTAAFWLVWLYGPLNIS